MRLLDKREIDKSKVLERAREIQEGRKLAERVDSLRETAAKEEAALAKFRTETLSKIHEEITYHTTARDTLYQEVKRLEERKREALKPIQEEIAALERKKAVFAEEKALFVADKDVLEQEKREVAAQSRLVQSEKQRAFSDSRLAAEALTDARKDKEAAKKALSDAESTRLGTLRLKEGVEKDLAHRSEALAAKERDVSLREEWVEREKEKLEKGWTRLKDRQEMLKRHLKSK